MAERAIAMIVTPLIVMFVLMAVIGTGNPAVDAAMVKVNADYPSLNGSGTGFQYCIYWFFDTWCMDDISLDWFNLVPAYVNVTMVKIQGFTEVTDEVITPQNFTIMGSDVAMDTVPFVYLFLTIIAGLGALIQFSELIPG